MVVIIVGIVAAVTAPVILAGFQTFFSSRGLSEVNAQGEVAMDRMAREVRGLDPSTDFNSSTLPTASQLKFILNPPAASQATYITYSQQGSTLLRSTYVPATSVSGADLLAADLSSVAFAYYKSDGTALTPPLTLAQAQSIWLIRISLQMASGQLGESLRTTVFLRSGPISR